jgi:hypothetical protein
MTEKKALKLFERYNPVSAITRCPNGRAIVREQLDKYAKAAVNLYGIISVTDFVQLFNSRNLAKTNNEEVFTLLLPIVLKKKRYCFYNGCIVHYLAMDNFDYADYLLSEQLNKPRYIPDEGEFIKYADEYYESEEQAVHWRKLYLFMLNEWPDNPHRYSVTQEIRWIFTFSAGLQETFGLLEKYNMNFKNDKSTQMFLDILSEAKNNTRLWENKGFTPNELMAHYARTLPKDKPTELVFLDRKKVGRNDPCPCGSGKKYKYCCLLTLDARTAQLSASECALFYTTWYALLGYVNEQKNVINAKIKPVYPNPVRDEQIYKVREVLWENPELITQYILASNLPPEQISLLESWRDRHERGMFFIVDYKPAYAVIIGPDKNGKDKLLGIKGISRSLADAMQRELPIQIETVLLPFKDMIIYDGFIASMPIRFADGAKGMFGEMYNNALGGGIATTLG